MKAGGLAALVFLVLAGCAGPQANRAQPAPGGTEGATSAHQELARMLGPESGLATAYRDAGTGVAYLDDYSPAVRSPLAEMPRGEENAFLLLPGGYEGMLETYSLTPGCTGPSPGDGYLVAPFRGPLGEVVAAAVGRAVSHPEVSRYDLQALVWALAADVPMGALRPELQDTAGLMLLPEEVQKVEALMRGAPSSERLSALLEELPDAERRVVEARVALRGMAQSGSAQYAEMERVAVAGPEAAGAVRPRRPVRWSYLPGCVFVRADPAKYSEVRMEVTIPPRSVMELDAKGRVVLLADASGSRVELEYDDALSGPQDVAWPLKRVRVEGPDPDAGGGLRSAEQRERGWVLNAGGLGWPVPATQVGLFHGLELTRTAAGVHRDEVTALLTGVERARGAAGAVLPPEEAQTLVQVAMLERGLRSVFCEGAKVDPWACRQAQGVRRAWMYALCVQTGDAEPVSVAEACGGGPGTCFDSSDPKRMADECYLEFRSALAQPLVLVSPDPMRQRLGLSNRGAPDQADAVLLAAGLRACSMVAWAAAAFQVVTEPPRFAEANPWGASDASFGAGIVMAFDRAEELLGAVGGDGSGEGEAGLRVPGPLNLPKHAGPGPDRAARFKAAEELVLALTELLGRADAAAAALAGLRAARKTGDRDGMLKQAVLLVEYKRQAGGALMRVARALEQVADQVESDGGGRPVLNEGAVNRYRKQVAAQGLSVEERQAGEALGLDAARLDEVGAGRAAFVPDEPELDITATLRTQAARLSALGARWSLLPTP
jgi:hypothetical protein